MNNHDAHAALQASAERTTIERHYLLRALDDAHDRRARFVTTPAGIRIGCAYTPPSPQFNADAEAVQRALIGQRRLDLLGWLDMHWPEVFVLAFVLGCAWDAVTPH
jgi:hypothetical protein